VKNFSAKAEGNRGYRGILLVQYLVLAYTDSPIRRSWQKVGIRQNDSNIFFLGLYLYGISDYQFSDKVGG